MQPEDKSRLRPQLNLFDAVATGLAAILGAGIFSVIAPAAGIAGPAFLASLSIAALIALCNALSSAQLASIFPRSGGTYEFGRQVLGPWWGYLAGWMFLIANTVGPGVIALTFGYYLHGVLNTVPPRVAAVLIVLVVTAINAAGIRRSVHVTDVIVILSIASLVAVIIIGLPHGNPANFIPFAPHGFTGILQATGLLFFAYTGYSRIATLVEEVHNPRRTIPRATVLVLGAATLLYLLVAGTAVAVLGTTKLSQSSSPLATTMLSLGSGIGSVIVAAGALLTTFNESLSDLLGVSRVTFAMSRVGDLPKRLAYLGPGKNPWLSVLFVGLIATIVSLFFPFEFAIAISSFGTLFYYSVTNLSVLKRQPSQRIYPRGLAIAGLVRCMGLSIALPLQDVVVGVAIALAGIALRLIRIRTILHRSLYFIVWTCC
jgi:basic amino acid/polyamine antiporter, APA family